MTKNNNPSKTDALNPDQIAAVTGLECDMQNVLDHRYADINGAIPPNLLGNELVVKQAAEAIAAEADLITGYANIVTFKARVDAANQAVHFTVSIHPIDEPATPKL